MKPGARPSRSAPGLGSIRASARCRSSGDAHLSYVCESHVIRLYVLLIGVLVLQSRLIRELLARDVLALREHVLVGLLAVGQDGDALVDGVVGGREVVGALRRGAQGQRDLRVWGGR